MKKNNQRKWFPDRVTIFLSIGFLAITLVILMVFFMSIFTQITQSLPLGSSAQYKPDLSNPLYFFLFIFWTAYGFLLSYHYSHTRIMGIFFRLEKLFLLLAQGKNRAMTFRKNDPFKEVSHQFNHMMEQYIHKKELLKSLEALSSDVKGKGKEKLEKFIQELRV